MFKLIIYCVLFLNVNLGCATRSQEYGAKDEHFEVFIHSYINETKKYDTINQTALVKDLYSLTIQFGKVRSETELGVCSIIFSGGKLTKRITINKDKFFNMSYGHQEELLFHELTHCLFHVRHNDSVDKTTGKPKSIMNTYQTGLLAGPNRDKYIQQLFTVDIYINRM